MRLFKMIVLCFFCLVITGSTIAQRSKNNHSKSRKAFKSTKVKGSKAKLICPIFQGSQYPYHGLGLKLGDPFAITYKYYPSKKISIAVDFGKPSSGLYNRYFRDNFKMYVREGEDTLSDNSSLTYSFHRLRSDLIGELKLLYHFEGDKISPGLQVYAGIGWEWKSTKLRYDYLYNRSSPVGGEPVPEFRTFDRQRITMGPQAVVGIEYAYFKIPVSAFMEVEYFTDIQLDPGWQRFEGGVGLRYVF
jgi:hypothetical protein